jgi:hypothetical protein
VLQCHAPVLANTIGRFGPGIDNTVTEADLGRVIVNGRADRANEGGDRPVTDEVAEAGATA